MSNYKFDYNQYKQRINPQHKLSISVCIVLIIVLIGVACLVNQNTNFVEFHFVEIGTFLNYKEANSKSIELQQKNAGGYVYFDGTYHVLACAYINKDDAKTVAENLSNEYPTAKYFSLSTKEFHSNKYSKTEHESIEKVVDANEKIIAELYDIMIDFEQSNITYNQFDLKLKKLSSFYSEKTGDFLTIFKVNSPISTLKEKISTIQSCLNENLEGYKLKYNLIKISINHYSFLEFFC